MKNPSKDQLTKKLVDLFNLQLQTLKDRGCPESIIDMFENQKSNVLAKAIKISFKKGNIIFLPVIPNIYRSIYDQMPMVKNGSQIGHVYLDLEEIINVVKTPQKPYYIFDIENGQAMLSRSSQAAEKIIKKQNRRCLIEVEVIALCVHTNVLSSHSVAATGSRCNSIMVPGLHLFHNQPELDWIYIAGVGNNFGSASCAIA